MHITRIEYFFAVKFYTKELQFCNTFEEIHRKIFHFSNTMKTKPLIFYAAALILGVAGFVIGMSFRTVSTCAVSLGCVSMFIAGYLEHHTKQQNE